MTAAERSDPHTQVADYLRAHHTMTIATAAPVDNLPHAAHVFYAVDDHLRLTFLSRPGSLHGQHIGKQASVALTVSEEYSDWRQIQGLQLWGTAHLLGGLAKAAALAHYLRRFPFARDVLREATRAGRWRDMGVYRVELRHAALTDNTSGLFGQEMVDLR